MLIFTHKTKKNTYQRKNLIIQRKTTKNLTHASIIASQLLCLLLFVDVVVCWIEIRGVTANRTKGHSLTDLYYLDLDSLLWHKVEYRGRVRAPEQYDFNVVHHRVHIARPNAYIDRMYGKLIVIFHGKLQHRKPKAVVVNPNDEDDNGENKEDEILQKLISNGCIPSYNGPNRGVMYIFDLQTKKWQFVEHNSSGKVYFPPNIFGYRLVRIGDLLVQIGGRTGKPNLSTVARNRRKTGEGGWVLKIPTRVSWERERLLWIGYLKNYNNEKCWFGTVPKDIIRLIVSFFYQASVYDEAVAKSTALLPIDFENDAKDSKSKPQSGLDLEQHIGRMIGRGAAGARAAVARATGNQL